MPQESAKSTVDPLRLYAGEDFRLPRTVRKLLVDKRQAMVDALASGIAKSFDDYRYRVGQIHGITDSIDLCDEIARQHNRGD